jgi:hypothetical protein
VRMRQALHSTGHMPDRKSGQDTAGKESKC